MASKNFYHLTALWKSLMSNFLFTEIERLISCYLLHRFSFGEWILSPSKLHCTGRGFFTVTVNKSGGALSDHLLHGLGRGGQTWGTSLGGKQYRLWASQLVHFIGYIKIKACKSEDIYGPSGENRQTQFSLTWVAKTLPGLFQYTSNWYIRSFWSSELKLLCSCRVSWGCLVASDGVQSELSSFQDLRKYFLYSFCTNTWYALP